MHNVDCRCGVKNIVCAAAVQRVGIASQKSMDMHAFGNQLPGKDYVNLTVYKLPITFYLFEFK